MVSFLFLFIFFFFWKSINKQANLPYNHRNFSWVSSLLSSGYYGSKSFRVRVWLSRFVFGLSGYLANIRATRKPLPTYKQNVKSINSGWLSTCIPTYVYYTFAIIFFHALSSRNISNERISNNMFKFQTKKKMQSNFLTRYQRRIPKKCETRHNNNPQLLTQMNWMNDYEIG